MYLNQFKLSELVFLKHFSNLVPELELNQIIPKNMDELEANEMLPSLLFI